MSVAGIRLLQRYGMRPGAAVEFAVTSATSVTTPQSTTHTISLPSDISANDLLIICFRMGSSAETASAPSGFTQLTTDSTNGRSYVWWKKAAGTEGSSITSTSTTERKSAHQAYLIKNAGTSETAYVEGAVATASPPSLTPSWGAKENLWFSFASCRYTTTFTAPTNYGNLVQSGHAHDQLVSVETGVARRLLNATSEQPGAWGTTGTPDGFHYHTIAVRPA